MFLCYTYGLTNYGVCDMVDKVGTVDTDTDMDTADSNSMVAGNG